MNNVLVGFYGLNTVEERIGEHENNVKISSGTTPKNQTNEKIIVEQAT